jgi:ribosomal small subunit protein bTHX
MLTYADVSYADSKHTQIVMGRGDKRTAKGKRFSRSNGKVHAWA